jgi:carboxypeptidase family protein
VKLAIRRRTAARAVAAVLLLIGGGSVLSDTVAAQALTGALIGTVKDAQGGVVRGAVVRVTSPALIGGQETMTTNDKGQMRFPVLPPGEYVLDIELPGFASYHEAEIRIGAGATIERTAVLQLAGIAQSVVVEGAGSRIEARDPGFGTRFGPGDVRTIPTRRNSMFDFIKSRPWDLSHGTVERHERQWHEQYHLGVRLEHERESLPVRWHELHLSV